MRLLLVCSLFASGCFTADQGAEMGQGVDFSTVADLAVHDLATTSLPDLTALPNSDLATQLIPDLAVPPISDLAVPPAPDLAVDPCMDGKVDGSESDVDCGGNFCPKCAVGLACNGASDCASGSCTNGFCRVPGSCMDGNRNNAETDIDCGGGVCAKCPLGKGCLVMNDCTTNFCAGNLCCNPGFGNCDGNPGNGCETNLDTNDLNCSRCGNACPQNTPMCVAGACVPVQCTNGSKVDCNPANTTLGNAAFVDPAPPQDWVQCFGFINSVGDDVTKNALDNCLGATKLRIRFYDSNDNLVVDVFDPMVTLGNSWPMPYTNIGSGVTVVKSSALWPNSSTAALSTDTVGCGAGNWCGWAAGGPMLANGNCGPASISVSDVDGKELSTMGCNGPPTSWSGYKIAVFK